MRGLFSFFSADTGFSDFHTALVVLSADPDTAKWALTATRTRFPYLHFTFVAPEAYRAMLPPESGLVSLEQAKRSPLRFVREIRSRNFDLCIVLHPGRPSFRKAKILPFFVNARRILIYNEEGEFIPLSRHHSAHLFRHFGSRAARKLRWLALPCAMAYLALRTLRLQSRVLRHRVGAGN